MTLPDTYVPLTASPYVAIATDPDTGRAIIALDAAAVDALDTLLCALPLAHDMSRDLGLSDDDAVAVTAVTGPLASALGRFLRGF